MKRVLSILTLFLAIGLPVLAQSQNCKKWSEGMLSWDDFNGSAVMKTTPSHFAANLNTVSEEDIKGGKKMLYRITAEALMSRDESYADSTVRTAQKLRYYQLMFDQLELYRRRLQNDLNTGMSGIEADKRLAHYRSLYKDQVKAIEKETENGTNDKRLQEWEYYTRKGLEEMGLPAAPEFEPGDWSYGIYLGIGGSFTTQDIEKYFGNCATFTAGLTAGYKRVKVKADIAYGQPDFNTRNVFDKKQQVGGVIRDIQMPINECPTFLSVGTTAGFSIFTNKRFEITPFAGVHWSGYSWNVANLEWVYDNDKRDYYSKIKNTESAKLKDVSWIAGLDLDIKLHRYVSNTPFILSGQREQFTSSLRITPYVMYADYKEIAARGYHLGVTVSYSGIARALSVK